MECFCRRQSSWSAQRWHAPIAEARRVAALVCPDVRAVGHFHGEAARRSVEYNDVNGISALSRDTPSTPLNRLTNLSPWMFPRETRCFVYLKKGRAIRLDSIGARAPRAARGLRRRQRRESFWWSRGSGVRPSQRDLPSNWILALKCRPHGDRGVHPTYGCDVADPPLESCDIRSARAGSRIFCHRTGGPGQVAYPVASIIRPVRRATSMRFRIDNRSRLPAATSRWTAWLKAEDALYTFESNSDDGSWVYLNDRLAVDNGGTHSARSLVAQCALRTAGAISITLPGYRW